VKVVAVVCAAGLCLMAPLSLLFTSGASPPSCRLPVQGDAVLAAIRTIESSGDYEAEAAGSTASGAYQLIDSTWDDYGGYARASDAPPEVQDRKAAEFVAAILDEHDGDIAAVPVVWYLGHLPELDDPEWDVVPGANRHTPREYQQRWLEVYEDLLSGNSSETTPSCTGSNPMLVGGFAVPGPAELFSRAPVDRPHHDYPAWDWAIPVGTPIYAVRGGTVTAVDTWAGNWFTAGCQSGGSGCNACGVGVTILDAEGATWTYCHGSSLDVDVGAQVQAGTQLMVSGNSGRSTGPHLHLQIRTPDGQRRCPQPLLTSLRDQASGVDLQALPTVGCTS
jgi:murein DD-endopeptidase MepM/ murein hydrolase activator NlpD